MTAGLQVTKAIASFSTIFMPGLPQRHEAKTWECLLKSVAQTPTFPFSKLFSFPPHSQAPLVSLLLYHAAGGVHFWTHHFLGSMISAKATFSVSAAEVCLSHH